ncbi:MAG: hypothetical protein EOL95_07110 [Bacteroidia bacterium]|nr:hypothetical protein [Bacteroidia bacterium]
MDAGNIISSVLSLIAIALTIIMYFKHDKRLKKQEEKLNAYQIRKIEDEESNNKKAQVRGNIIKGDKGRRDMRIYNMGKSPAKNIYINFLDNSDEKVTIMKYPSPYEFLNIGDHFDIIMHLYIGGSDVLKVKLAWEDDYSNQNEHIQHFKLT